MDNLIEGSSERNYEKLSRDFTERLKSVVTKDNFEKQMDENILGEFSRREFLSIIHKKNSIFVLWKQWFTKSSDEFLAEAEAEAEAEAKPYLIFIMARKNQNETPLTLKDELRSQNTPFLLQGMHNR